MPLLGEKVRSDDAGGARRRARGGSDAGFVFFPLATVIVFRLALMLVARVLGRSQKVCPPSVDADELLSLPRRSRRLKPDLLQASRQGQIPDLVATVCRAFRAAVIMQLPLSPSSQTQKSFADPCLTPNVADPYLFMRSRLASLLGPLDLGRSSDWRLLEGINPRAVHACPGGGLTQGTWRKPCGLPSTPP